MLRELLSRNCVKNYLNSVSISFFKLNTTGIGL